MTREFMRLFWATDHFRREFGARLAMVTPEAVYFWFSREPAVWDPIPADNDNQGLRIV